MVGMALAGPATPLEPPAAGAPPLADPVVRADVRFSAVRTTAWSEDGSRYLLLDGDARFQLGVYGFRGSRAVARITTERLPGRTLRYLAIYIDNARPLGEDGARVGAEAQRLLVTATTSGGVALETDLLDPADQPPTDPLLFEATSRFARYDESQTRVTADGPVGPLVDPQQFETRTARREQITQQQSRIDQKVVAEAAQRGEEMARREAIRAEARDEPDTAAPPPAPSTVLPTRGVVRFTQDRIYGEARDDGAVIMLIGDVNVIYNDYEGRQDMSLRAQRAVIFLTEDWRDAARQEEVDASVVRGIYLEDNVIATDGAYTVRAPRVYYDLALNKAILLDAVMYTWEVEEQVPLYLRADVMRQTSATSFNADRALLTTSEFGEPHFAIGSRRVTIEQHQTSGGAIRQKFTGVHNTFEFGGLPLFYWPYIAGDDREIPLREVGVGYSEDDGPQITTTWDLFALVGYEAPDGVDLEGNLDYLGDHGVGLGTEFEYDVNKMFGQFNAYILPYDTGEDEIDGRNTVKQDGDTRGYALWQHRQILEDNWELSLEGAYVSDVTFLEEFFPDQAYEAKPYETSLYVKKQEDDWALTLLNSYDLIDFTPQLTTLQTPGYTVEKLPELGFFTTGVSFWDDRLTWTSDTRLSRMRMHFGNDSPSDRGFTNNQSMQLFGIPAAMPFDTAFESAGFPGDWVGRFDTRQEIAAPLNVGIFNVTPYAVGRVTAYDDDFVDFAGQDDPVRLWGMIGTRVHTQFNRVYDGVENRVLNINGLRHIIEPSINIFYADTTIDEDELPVFDYDVEHLAQGGGVTLGLKNTLQTRRGGPGRERTVDWITLTTNYTFRDKETDPDFEIARFFDYRPEYSVGGDHFYAELLWMVSDVLAVTGELTYGAEDFDQVVQWRVGMSMQHTPRLSTYINYQEIHVLMSQLLTYGISYQLTTKYRVGVQQTYDFHRDDTSNFDVIIERKLPRWTLRLIASIDEIEEDQSIGVVLIPDGLGGGGGGSGGAFGSSN